ncbi:Outer membrane lipoprotein [Candidatus Liberibacter solanacearum]
MKNSGLLFLLSFFSLTFIGSCSITPMVDNQILLPSIVGYWEDDNGILSQFQKDGTFKTISTDGSSSILATGFYSEKANQGIDIQLTSLIRGTSEKIQCEFIEYSKLTCIAQNKKQFYLRRTHLTEVPVTKPQNDNVIVTSAEDPNNPNPSPSIIYYN